MIDALNFLIDAVNTLSFDIPDWVPGIGGKHFGFDIPQIPYLAKGGIVDKPTTAMIGEAGAEAIVPLEKNTKWLDEIAKRLAREMSSATNSGGSSSTSTNVTNNFYQTNNSPKPLSRLEIYRQSKNLLSMKGVTA